jgi:hypothetical protein
MKIKSTTQKNLKIFYLESDLAMITTYAVQDDQFRSISYIYHNISTKLKQKEE